MYDYLVVGAGLFGAIFAHEAKKAGRSVLVIDRRSHIAGNCYTEDVGGIQVHRYGAHIFHTDNREVWEYLQQFGRFNRYTNSPVAVYRDELYNLPFNMNTFSKLWGIRTPQEAEEMIARQRAEITGEPQNLEEQAIALIGRDVYEKLVKGYTEKQWGRRCTELPPHIIRRLPVRLVYDNNYFNDAYQGIPEEGYTALIANMLKDIPVQLDTDFLADRANLSALAKKIVYTGAADAFYDYKLGRLEYRSLRFETEDLPVENYQGNAVVNYTEYEIPYTRIIEHKHFTFGCQTGTRTDHTVITREYPVAWTPGAEPYYPMSDERNTALYAQYKALADAEPNVIFGGRMGTYRYLDMHQVAAEALACARRELSDPFSSERSCS